VRFNNRAFARTVGPLPQGAWPAHLQEQHGWITESPRYLWRFVAAMIDTSATIRRRGKAGLSIVLHMHARAEATYVIDLLTKLGVQHALLTRDRSRREGIRGVTINTQHDLWHIARHIHSIIPSIEVRLAPLRGPEPAPPRLSISREDAVAEWTRITAILGHAPRYHEMDELYHLGQTRYSASVYAYRFGRCSDNPLRGRFSMARTRLEQVDHLTPEQQFGCPRPRNHEFKYRC